MKIEVIGKCILSIFIELVLIKSLIIIKEDGINSEV